MFLWENLLNMKRTTPVEGIKIRIPISDFSSLNGKTGPLSCYLVRQPFFQACLGEGYFYSPVSWEVNQMKRFIPLLILLSIGIGVALLSQPAQAEPPAPAQPLVYAEPLIGQPGVPAAPDTVPVAASWEMPIQFNVSAPLYQFQTTNRVTMYFIDPEDPNPFNRQLAGPGVISTDWPLLITGWTHWLDWVDLGHRAASFGTQAAFCTPFSTGGWCSTPNRAQVCLSHANGNLPVEMINFSYGRSPAVQPMTTSFQASGVLCAWTGLEFPYSTGQRYVVRERTSYCPLLDEESGLPNCWVNILAAGQPQIQYSIAELGDLLEETWVEAEAQTHYIYLPTINR